MLIDQLKRNTGVIHVLNRAQLLDDALNFARYNHITVSRALDLMQYLQHETDFIPMVPGIKLMDLFLRRFDGQDFYGAFEVFSKAFRTFQLNIFFLQKIVIETVRKMYDIINTPKTVEHPDDAHFTKLSKLTVNMFACRLGIGKCSLDLIVTISIINV